MVDGAIQPDLHRDFEHGKEQTVRQIHRTTGTGLFRQGGNEMTQISTYETATKRNRRHKILSRERTHRTQKGRIPLCSLYYNGEGSRIFDKDLRSWIFFLSPRRRSGERGCSTVWHERLLLSPALSSIRWRRGSGCGFAALGSFAAIHSAAFTRLFVPFVLFCGDAIYFLRRCSIH